MIRALFLALTVVAFAAGPASAGIIAPQDASELAQSLAEAQEEQDVCYGWQVSNNFSGSPDVGSSNGGPGVPLIALQGSCPKGIVVLRGDIYYSCGSCESSDSAGISISASGMANPPTVDDLKDLGLKDGALTGDDDDTTLINMVEALPLLVADRGNAPYVAYEPATTVPATDHATNSPGSDLLRDNWFFMVLFGGLIVSAPVFFVYKRAQAPKRPRPESKPTPPAASAPPPPTSEPPPSSSEPPPPTSEPPPTSSGPPAPASGSPPPAT